MAGDIERGKRKTAKVKKVEEKNISGILSGRPPRGHQQNLGGQDDLGPPAKVVQDRCRAVRFIRCEHSGEYGKAGQRLSRYGLVIFCRVGKTPSRGILQAADITTDQIATGADAGVEVA